VVRHEVEEELEAAPVRFVEQPVKVIHRPEYGVYADVIGYVVTEVRHR
jgi:hypothetical protein